MKIAIQGVKGSFHDQAASLINKTAEILPRTKFKDVFAAVRNGEATHGLVAIENSLHGSINEIYRLLDNGDDLWITQTVTLHIKQNLVGYELVSLENLKTKNNLVVISHPVALAQVDGWLTANLPKAKREEYDDTASAVQAVVAAKDSSLLAVAGDFASQMYEGTVLEESIQDDPKNYTRFVLFQKGQVVAQNNPTHGSVIIQTSHEAGSLLNVLSIFNDYNSNLTKLDSHPIPGDDRHYKFYIDYELPLRHDEMLISIEKLGYKVKLLGEYREIKDNS